MYNFSEALIFMKEGCGAYRSGWNGKNIIVYQYHPTNETLTDDQIEQQTVLNSYFRIWNKESRTIDSWLASSSDLQATDWQVRKNL